MSIEQDANDLGRRRLPTQARGKNTVDCILLAARQIIESQRNADTTTNKIAEKAGVSISSLYQYFANKEAIFLALYYSTASNVANLLREETIRALDLEARPALEQLCRAALDIYEVHQPILINLAEEVPELRSKSNTFSIGTLMYNGSRVYMERHFRGAKIENAELVYYFMHNTVVSSIRSYLLMEPENISREEFIHELARMLSNYINDYIKD